MLLLQTLFMPLRPGQQASYMLAGMTLLFAALSSAGTAVAGSPIYSYLNTVGHAVSMMNRIYLTQYYSLPTDTISWTATRRNRHDDSVIAPTAKRCVDHEDPSDILVPAGDRYALKPELTRADIKAWPLKCIPVKSHRDGIPREEFVRAGLLTVRMFNLIDPERFVDAVLGVAQDPSRLAEYAMSRERYVELYPYNFRDTEDSKASMQRFLEKNMPLPIGFDLERSVWNNHDLKNQYGWVTRLIDTTVRPKIRTTGAVTEIEFRIRPYK